MEVKIKGIAWLVGRYVVGQKEDGGLGLGDLVSKNSSQLAKWLWRFP